MTTMAKTKRRKGRERKTPKQAIAFSDDQRDMGYLAASINMGACPVRDGHLQRHVDGRLTRAQAEELKRVRQYLDETGSRTTDGKHVRSLMDVVRYIAELLAAELDPSFVPYGEVGDAHAEG